MSTPPLRPPSARRTALRWLLGGVVLVAVLAGCMPAKKEPTGARVLVTADQGTRAVLDESGIEVLEGDRVLDVLQRAADVTLEDDGETVAAIDGAAATGGRAWSFWVNGVEIRGGPLPETDQDPAEQQQADVATVKTAEVTDGDTIWFDLRSAPQVGQPRGVVGTFPEPFTHGYGGRRWPTRVECLDPRSDDCERIRQVLVDYGLPTVGARFRSTEAGHSARVSVGTWSQIRVDPAVQLAERGPAASGIYAVPDPGGREIALLDAAGETVTTVGPGTGLIFASRYRDEPPTWVVTGTDAAGVRAAVEAWDPDVLARHYAVVVRDERVTAVPVAPAR